MNINGIKKQQNNWSVSEILDATKGRLICGDLKSSFNGISIDSRTICAGEMFVAIKGKIHDGHGFVQDVIRQKACGIIVDHDKIYSLPDMKQNQKNVCVAVKDTTKALGSLALYNRKRFNPSVVAITGSNGKTTTKEMIFSILKRYAQTLCSHGNYNNEIGVPLTLLRLTKSHKYVVLELGMNHPGEIANLAQMCLPDIGIITNIGYAHLEGMESIEGVMHAKGEMLDNIKPDGTAILNADDNLVLKLADRFDNNLFFGFSEKAAVSAQNIETEDLHINFNLVLPGESISIAFDTPAVFMVSNALAAASACYELGLSAQQIKAGLEAFHPVKGRLNIIKTSQKINIIDDTYNANPVSMEAAITTLETLKKDKRSVLVLGDMYELGRYSEPFHRNIGTLAVLTNVSRIYLLGKFAQTIAEGIYAENKAFKGIIIGTVNEILDDMLKWLRPDDWVLVKGSRAMAMEGIINKLKNAL